MIQKAMETINYNVNLKQAAKVQALILIKKLTETIRIERLKLNVKLSFKLEDNYGFLTIINNIKKADDDMIK